MRALFAGGPDGLPRLGAACRQTGGFPARFANLLAEGKLDSR